VSERPARARLFAALDLPEATRGALAAWAADATRGREGLRLIDATMLHVTLCFLGWREEGEAEAIGHAVTGSAAGAAPELAVGAAAWLPPRRPRVLAIDLEDAGGALTALQRKVSDALVAAAGYAPERRPYRPHVTVARVRASARLRPFALDPPTVAPFRGPALTLYRSFPAPGGARYDPVARVGL
jgi:RNA 2',3'-cyclic 3'-phosphodiesterase